MLPRPERKRRGSHQQEFATETIKIRVGVMLPRILRDSQSSIDRCQGALQISPHGLKLCQQAVERRRAALVALSKIGRQRLPEPKRARVWIALLTANPVRIHLTEVSVGLQVELFC